MGLQVVESSHEAISPMRQHYRSEMNCQIVHDSWHERGFTTCHLISIDGRTAGYGCVSGDEAQPRVIVKEFWISPEHRPRSLEAMCGLIRATGALAIETQTNDPQLHPMLLQLGDSQDCRVILFSDQLTTCLPNPGVSFRPITRSDLPRVFAHTTEPVGDYVLELAGQVVATGGVLYHYNPPFGDVFMEVEAGFRRRGYGSYLVQELKRICRESGGVPAARCNESNRSSRATLERAGLLQCGRIIRAPIRMDLVR